MCRPIRAHDLTVSAEKTGPEFDQLTEDHRLFVQNEEEELTMRPTLSWNVPMRGCCVQTHAVPRVQTGPHPFSHKGLFHISGTMPRQISGQKSSFARILHARQSFLQCHNRVFEVLLPQFQSRLISSQNVVFAFWVIKILLPCLWPPSFSTGLSLFDFHLASLLPLPYSFLCSAPTILTSPCLQYLCRSPGKKHAIQRLPKAVPTCPPQCDRH